MTLERARCPVCTDWLRFGTVDGLTVAYCGTCRTEAYVPRRLPDPPLRGPLHRPHGKKGKQAGERDKTPRGPTYRAFRSLPWETSREA